MFMYLCMHRKKLIHMQVYIYIFIYIHFFKIFLKQLSRINSVCRIIVLVAAIYYALIAMMVMNNLVHFLPSKLMSHHTSYLFCI